MTEALSTQVEKSARRKWYEFWNNRVPFMVQTENLFGLGEMRVARGIRDLGKEGREVRVVIRGGVVSKKNSGTPIFREQTVILEKLGKENGLRTFSGS